MLLIFHAVSRQLTAGSLPTQLVLAVWVKDVQTDLFSFCRAEKNVSPLLHVTKQHLRVRQKQCSLIITSHYICFN